jgi:hypothetical protein
MEQLVFHWADFHETLCWGLLLKYVVKIEIWLKSADVSGALHEGLSMFVFSLFFPTHTPCSILILSVFYSPTDAQLNCLKNNFKFHIKIDIKTAPTCFGAITIIRERIIRVMYFNWLF